ncbi:DUF1097 domain-containing protein [Streptomyces sp. MBT53]|uniref:DUF1097 domain-containing protein n=1 Tax=Streptomyces sp. MBT53 TaxID=1488384 RepID=UPI0019117A03|nr:DUF1097 domain-containing protein [Streptomyces sp. MBT53]MBK6016870.1 DUF1097 domain-containing protein [Streptomyces sp. MBT53]
MNFGRIRLQHEVSASIVDFATVFLLMSPLKMPTWAIFITWAGTPLQGGPSRSNALAMVTATTTGAGFGVVAVLLNRETGTMFGTGAFAQTLALAVVVFVVNGTLLATGRLKPFALVPGMFFGFASLFAPYFGGFGFGYDAGHLDAAFVSSAAMCALGPLCAPLGLRLMLAPPPTAPEPVAQFGVEEVTASVHEAPA